MAKNRLPTPEDLAELTKLAKAWGVEVKDIIENFKEMNSIMNSSTSYINGMTSQFTLMSNQVDRILSTYKNTNGILLAFPKIQKQIIDREQKRLSLVQKLNKQAQEGNTKAKLLLKTYAEIEDSLDKIITKSKRWVKEGLQAGFNYLKDADKAIKGLNTSIGISGNRASDFRDTIANAGRNAAQLGGSIEDLITIQAAYNQQLSTSVLLTSKQLTDMVAISKATNLSLETVGKMAGEYQAFGGSGEEFKNYVEDAVNTSRSLGLNVNKVLGQIDKNMNKMNMYNFKRGREGLKDMAQYATKMNVQMESLFASANKARGLEGSMEMAAQLNVLGGEFAKSDPFRLLNLARNDAAGFAKEIGSMTKNMVSFNKTTGQLDMTALDKDRLKLAAEALNMPFEDLFNTALKNAKDQMVGVDLKNKGFSNADKETISQLAQLNEKGQMTIKVGDTQKLLKDLSSSDLSRIKTDKQRLEDIAKENQSFDEILKSTILELKSLLLPFLDTFNKGLKWLNDFTGNSIGGLVAKMGIMVTALAGFSAIGSMLVSTLGKGLKTLLSGGLSMAAGKTPTTPSLGGGGLGTPDVLRPGGSPGGAGGRGLSAGMGSVGSRGAVPDAGGLSRATKGTDALGTSMSKTGGTASAMAKGLLAFGGAVLMIGGGVFLATKGISAMADSFSKLNPEQMTAVKDVLIGLGVTIGGLAATMALLSPVLGAASLGLLAFGGAITLIGAGIGIAALGISTIFDSLANVAGKNISSELTSIAGGIMAVNGALLTGGLSSIFGGSAFESSIESLKGIQDINFDSMANAFSEANKFVNADLSKLDKMIEGISMMENVKIDANGDLINTLKDLQSKGIPVHFPEDQKVNIVVNVTTKIDSTEVYKQTEVTRVRLKSGK